MERDHAFEEDRLGARDVLDRLPGHGIRQEADEIAGMPGLERNADLAVGLEAADARTVSGARIDDDERTARRIDLDALRRHDPHQNVVDRPVQLPAVHHEFHLVVEHVRGGLRQVLAVLIAALAHDVPEQHAALGRIRHVLDRGSKWAEFRGEVADLSGPVGSRTLHHSLMAPTPSSTAVQENRFDLAQITKVSGLTCERDRRDFGRIWNPKRPDREI